MAIDKASSQDNASVGISLSILNDANQKAEVYVGQATTLDVTLVNNTGGTITLPAGDNPATFAIFLPVFYSDADLKNMSIDLPNYKVTIGSYSIKLEYDGSSDGSWSTGEFSAIRFQIKGAKTDHAPANGQVAINFSNLKGNSQIPVQTTTDLNLTTPPKPGNADLTEALSVSLDSETVYVSDSDDPLDNTLFLNFKNILDSKPLYSGSGNWPGSPQVIITFIYGKTAGALAPDDDKDNPQLGSAWNIRGKTQISNGNDWSVDNADTSTQDRPSWVLKPANTNQKIIGTGAASNITFSFSNIVSLTPAGNTNMIVHFTGFYQDENTPYNDHIFVLNIRKQLPPADRGILKFFSTTPTVTIDNLSKPAKAQFQWTLFQTHQIKLTAPAFPSRIKPFAKTYKKDQTLVNDQTAIDLEGFSSDVTINFNLDAYDGNTPPKLIDSQTFPVSLVSEFFKDPRDGKVYKVVRINGKTWLAQNFDYAVPGESFYYNKQDSYAEPYGRLYTLQGAKAATPEGWRLPLKEDWEDLVRFYGGAVLAYKAMIKGGKSDFEGLLGGWRQNNGGYRDLKNTGYYWTATPDDHRAGYTNYAQFTGSTKKVLFNAFPDNSGFSCRYVKNEPGTIVKKSGHLI